MAKSREYKKTKMVSDEREDLIKFIHSHTKDENSEHLAVLTDAELRWRAQIIASSQALKKEKPFDSQKKEDK